jgi:hypothetical protein
MQRDLSPAARAELLPFALHEKKFCNPSRALPCQVRLMAFVAWLLRHARYMLLNCHQTITEL